MKPILTSLILMLLVCLPSPAAANSTSAIKLESDTSAAGRNQSKFFGSYAIDATRTIVIADCDFKMQQTTHPNLPLCFLEPSSGRIGVLRPSAGNTYSFGKDSSAIEIRFVVGAGEIVEGLIWSEKIAPPVFAQATRSVSYEYVTLKNGGVTLAGRIALPSSPGKHPAVVMIHGSGPGSRDYANYGLLATYLAHNGMAVLSYDKRGYGASVGARWQEASFEDLADDARAAVEFLKRRSNIQPNRIGLYGHSQGGYVAPLVPSSETQVAFMCLLASPAVNKWDQEINEATNDLNNGGFSESEKREALDAMRLMFRVVADGKEIESLRAVVKKARTARWWGVVELSSAEQDLHHWRLNAYDPKSTLEKLTVPVMSLFGERDSVVPPDQNAGLWERYLKTAGNKDLAIRVIPNADHGLMVSTDGLHTHGGVGGHEHTSMQMAPGVLDSLTSWMAKQSGLPVRSSPVSQSTVPSSATQKDPVHPEVVPDLMPKNSDPRVGTYALNGGQTAVVFKMGDLTVIQDFTTGRLAGLFPVAEKPGTYKLVAHGPTPTPAKVTFHQTNAVSSIVLLEPATSERRGRKTDLRVEEVSFTNGDVRLTGTLVFPASAGPHPAVVFVHGSGAASRMSFYTWAMLFARHGIAALAFDKRGTGTSTGNFQAASFEDLAADVLAGFDLLKSRNDIDAKQIGLLGTSQGPWVMGIAASRRKEIAFLISSSGGPVTPARQEIYRRLNLVRDAGYSSAELNSAEKLLEQYFAYLGRGEQQDGTAVSKLWLEYQDKPWFKLLTLPASDPTAGEWPDVRRRFAAELFFDSAAHYRRINLPILALFGEADKTIPVQETIAAFNNTLSDDARKQFTIEIFPKANHGFLLPAVPGDVPHIAPGYFDKIIRWVKQQVTIRTVP